MLDAVHLSFYAIALAMCIASLRMVTTRNVVHAALYLVVVLAGVAATYVLLAAEFLAAVQVLVYIGAIVVLLLFGVMLTRAPIGREATLDNDQRLPAVIVAGLTFAGLTVLLVRAFSDVPVQLEAQDSNTTALADSIFGTYVVPFEVVSLLLLAALVGAVVIARRD